MSNGAPAGLRYSERELWDRATRDRDQAVLNVLGRLARARGGVALEDLLEPGRPRAAAVGAVRRELRMGLGLCRDKCDPIARRLVERAVEAAAGAR